MSCLECEKDEIRKLAQHKYNVNRHQMNSVSNFSFHSNFLWLWLCVRSIYFQQIFKLNSYSSYDLVLIMRIEIHKNIYKNTLGLDYGRFLKLRNSLISLILFLCLEFCLKAILCPIVDAKKCISWKHSILKIGQH